MFPRARGLPSSVVSRWGISRQMSTWLLRNARHYDLIHVDYVWPWSTLIAAIAGSRSRHPGIMTAHESLTNFDIKTNSGPASRKQQAKLWMRRIIMRYIDLLVMTSEMELADSVRSDEHAVVVPHPVIAEPPETPMLEPPMPPLIVGYIGRLHPKKNIDVLLRAVAMLEVSTKVIVCGQGDASYCSQLKQLEDKAFPNDMHRVARACGSSWPCTPLCGKSCGGDAIYLRVLRHGRSRGHGRWRTGHRIQDYGRGASREGIRVREARRGW